MALHGKVMVVTGGASGIGRATALRCARDGAAIVIADRNAEAGATVAAEIGANARFIATDVSRYDDVEAAVQLAVSAFGGIDVMFNNAGTGLYKSLLDVTPDEFDHVVRVNQHGVFYGIKAAGLAMRARGRGGVIINTASVYAYLASTGVIAYHASKAAVRMMTQAAALELAPYDIRVVAIAPGTVDTPIIQGYKDAGLTEVISRAQMRRKMLTPDQMANIVAFLATDDASAINASTVMADDGLAEFK
jgi:NAD(P)-dependent dehydrogenase (short-subunit alcohol dehydrogenase family)